MNYGLELMFPERKNIIVSKQEGGLEEKEKMPRNIAHSRVHATVTQKPIFFLVEYRKTCRASVCNNGKCPQSVYKGGMSLQIKIVTLNKESML